jgi:hypothetical protein
LKTDPPETARDAITFQMPTRRNRTPEAEAFFHQPPVAIDLLRRNPLRAHRRRRKLSGQRRHNGRQKTRPPGPGVAHDLLVKDADTKGLETILDPSWQVARADGSNMGKSEFLVKVGNGKINLDDFKFGKMNVTRSESALVVRYLARGDYTIKGVRYKGTPAPYLASFIRKDGRWLMISQANFDLPAK